MPLLSRNQNHDARQWHFGRSLAARIVHRPDLPATRSVPDLGLHIPPRSVSIGYCVLCIVYCVLCIVYCVSYCVSYRVSCFVFRVSCFVFRVSCFKFQVSRIVYRPANRYLRADFLAGQFFDIRLEVHSPVNGSEANGGVPDPNFTFSITRDGKTQSASAFFAVSEPALERWNFTWYEGIYWSNLGRESSLR